MACTDKRRCVSLLDLPESLITGILRCLPTRSKCQAETVCRTFREVLSNPITGGFVWEVLDLDGSLFQKLSVHGLNRQVLSIAYRTTPVLAGIVGVL